MSAFRIVMTVVSVLVVGLMVWDQIRCKSMTAGKWPLAALLLLILLANTWGAA